MPGDNTSVYKIPRSTAWEIPGWHRSIFVSNGGTVAIAYEGLSLLPLNFSPEVVLVQIWRDGHVIRPVYVRDVVKKRRDLRRTASHYEWGNVQGFENESLILTTVTGTRVQIAAGTGNTIRGKPCLFDFEVGEVPDCIRKAAKGDLFIIPKYVKKLSFESNGLAAVSPLDGTWMYVNRKGKVLITGVPRFDNGADFFHDGLVRVVHNGKYGFANRTGKVVIPAVYDGAMYFENGRAQVCKGCVSKCAEPECEHHMFSGGEWTVIDTEGKSVK